MSPTLRLRWAVQKLRRSLTFEERKHRIDLQLWRRHRQYPLLYWRWMKDQIWECWASPLLSQERETSANAFRIYHPERESSETSSSHFRSGMVKPVARCPNKRKSSRDSKCCVGPSLRKRKDSFWASRYPQFPWNASWSSCSRRTNGSIKITWRRMSYENASWGTKRWFTVWSTIWAGLARIEGRMCGQSSSWIWSTVSSQRMELHQANQLSDQISERKELVVHWIGQERERDFFKKVVWEVSKHEKNCKSAVQKLNERNNWE